MLGQEKRQAVDQLLWMSPADRVYAILDGASIPMLLDQLYAQPRPHFECLYRGELEPDMQEVAPYLVELARDSEFADWCIARGWGNHWGIFVVTGVDFRAVRSHLRTLNIAYDPKGVPKRFRYYDPRVLNTLLPLCDAAQIASMFGPLERFVVESGDAAAALTYTTAGGALQVGTRQIAREK